MAGNIKGITIEFNGDTTRLDKALRQVKNSTRDIDRELKDVNKALKFNPTSVDLWRQKQDLLKQKISQTETNLKELKNTQAQLDAQGVDKNSEAYRRVQREIIEAESKLKTFKTQLKEVGNVKLRAVSEQFKAAGSALENAGNKMRGLSMAAAAVVASLGALTYKAAQTADELNTLSKVYGISTDKLQMYGAAAELVDVDVETIAKSHVKLEKTMYSAANGSTASAEAFEKLGVNIYNADGSLRDADEVWNDSIAALGKMETATERDAVAMQIMGKSAMELNPLIEDGGETYKQVADTMSKYDLHFIDQETLDAANEFNDSVDTMKILASAAFNEIGTTMAATLAPAMEKVVDLIGKLANWISNLSPQALTILGIVAGAVAVLAPILIVLGKVAFGISSIINLVAVVGPAIGGIVMALGPVLLIIAAVVAAGIVLYKNWDKIKAKAIELKDNIVAAWENVKTGVANALNAVKTTIMSAFTTIKNIVMRLWNNGVIKMLTIPIRTAVAIIRTAINTIKRIINGAKLQLPKFKLPHFKINGGKLPWGIGGKGTKPSISVDWYAKGAIFKKPTLLGAGAALKGVGEAGAEAVLPLDLLWDNMRSMADSIVNGVVSAQQMQAPGSPINITLYAYPSGPKMEQWVVDTYDSGKRRLG